MTLFLGEILCEQGLLMQSDVDNVLSIQQQATSVKRPYFGEICVSQGYCTEADVLQALSVQLSLPLLQPFLDEHCGGEPPADELLAKLFSEEWWSQQQAFPVLLNEQQGILYIAQMDIWDEFVASSVEQNYGLQAHPLLCSNYELRQLFSSVEEHAGMHGGGILEQESSTAPVVKFVNESIQRAIKEKASDIHFEINRNKFSVRYRVDGVLRTVDQPSVSQHAAVLSRIKLMAGLDISEKRLPQDGRIRVRLSGMQVDIRVATTPTVYGENAVLRLLSNEQQDTSAQVKKLDMFADHLAAIDKIISLKNGIFLITGPTGSGKTTSLYTILHSLNDDNNKIITVEDPVEYQMKGLTQIQVNSDIGLDFATVLRSALRQDPDIMLIGEMRDKETAQIAIQSALTGHFVLSTLHTNDAPSSFVRLKDIGIPDYLIKSTLVGVMAQRLVRKLCPVCSTGEHTQAARAAELGWQEVSERWPNMAPSVPEWKVPVGCDHCNGTGYKGRLAIFELMEWSADYDVNIDMQALQTIADQQNMRNLRQDALLRAAFGETSIDEVLRVVG
ncbi:type II/IV secretion system protein [Oceanimonas sp. CHS3-5]|uniref:GspE/PulE family protein n=1 Tax=Oceanimonas sp. CHS3-5 TaxID=3068186 RepID=UPI00273D4E37|nr:type II/IV secretion system protein [Oceanimonas sp. CHS3-5]MDP5293852.1 type II/IV secretion system protein [Oceanimonas sp. CHS3-5]